MAQDLTQWEYRKASTSDGAMAELNRLDEEGWEAAANSSPGTVLLKRPKQQQQPSRPKDDGR